MTAPSSSREVQARIRAGLIDVLELAASFESQIEYQRRVPSVHVPNEVIHQWEDWLLARPTRSVLDAAIITDDELEAIGGFHDVWSEVAAATPNPLPALDELQHNPHWRRLADAAATTLRVLQEPERLRLPDERQRDRS